MRSDDSSDGGGSPGGGNGTESIGLDVVINRLVERHRGQLREANESFKDLEAEIARIEQDLAIHKISQTKLIRQNLHGNARPPLPALPDKLNGDSVPFPASVPSPLFKESDSNDTLFRARNESLWLEPNSPPPRVVSLGRLQLPGSVREKGKSYKEFNDDGVDSRGTFGDRSWAVQEHFPAVTTQKSLKKVRTSEGIDMRPTKTVDLPKAESSSSFAEKTLERQVRQVRNRLQYVLGDATRISASDLCHIMQNRGLDARAKDFLDVFEGIHEIMLVEPTLSEEVQEAKSHVEDTVSMEALIMLICRPELRSLLPEKKQDHANKLAKALMMVTPQELVESAARTVGTEILTEGVPDLWEAVLNGAVFLSVFVSLFVTGTSIDYHPNSPWWTIVEASCCGVFTAEVAIKTYKWGPRRYLWGSSYIWNWADLSITLISLVDILFTIATQIQDVDRDLIPNASAFSGFMRMLRVTRIIRLLKLMRVPNAKVFPLNLWGDLVNMLIGLSIGVHALLSVLVIFCLVLYLIGLIFRLTVGPEDGQDLLSQCPNPDDLDDFSDLECPIWRLYGEVYFKSVKISMFTLFRFMMGDFTSYNGNSLALAFSEGYGDKFRVVFCAGMIAVYFGLFNIITAVFVDSTISGLKHNDLKRKQARRMVKEKVQALVDYVTKLWQRKNTSPSQFFKRSSSFLPTADGRPSLEDIVFGENEFAEVVDDPVVRTLLGDLDIGVYNAHALFETFDSAGTGQVGLAEFIEGLMKLRGEPSKNDAIASWVAIRSLHSKFDALSDSLRRMQGMNTTGTGMMGTATLRASRKSLASEE